MRLIVYIGTLSDNLKSACSDASNCGFQVKTLVSISQS